jgi:hypothetical protein
MKSYGAEFDPASAQVPRDRSTRRYQFATGNLRISKRQHIGTSLRSANPRFLTTISTQAAADAEVRDAPLSHHSVPRDARWLRAAARWVRANARWEPSHEWIFMDTLRQTGFAARGGVRSSKKCDAVLGRERTASFRRRRPTFQVGRDESIKLSSLISDTSPKR